MDYKFKPMTMKEKVCYVLDGRNDVRHPAYNLHELTDMRKAVEANFIEWHTYPQEEPTEGTYLVCCHYADGEVDMAFADYKADRFIGWGDTVFAWAFPPKAYEP